MKKIHRFLCEFEGREGVIIVKDPEVVKQISSVLKLKPGEQIIVGRGDGIDILASITSIEKGALYLSSQRSIKNTNEPEVAAVLYCSVLKKENFEVAVQKATEVGVTKVVPIISSRTIKTGFKVDRLAKIMKEAAEQSGRAIVPELGDSMSFSEAVEAAKENEINFFFEPSGEKFKSAVLKQAGEKRRVGIFIGPEGGWTDEEIHVAKEAGFELVSLGPLVLKAETAVSIASYLTVHNLSA